MAVKLWKTGTQNAFSTTLNGNVNAGDTAITLSAVTGLQHPGILVIDRLDADNQATPSLREYISYTGITGNQITGVTRGLGSSQDQGHNSGAKVEEVFSVTHWGDLLDYLAVSLNETTGKLKPEAWGSVSDGATIDFDISAAKKQVVILGGNRTLTVSNVAADDAFIIKLKQDGTGSRTVTWFDTISWPDNTAPTLSTAAGHWDIFGFIRTGTNTYDGIILGQNFQ